MDPLASQSDVEALLGRDLTTTEELRVDSLLRSASANVRRISTQMFTAETSTDVVLPISRHGKVRLSQRPVTAIASVTDIYDNVLTYTQAGEWLTVCSFPINSWELHLPHGWNVCEVKVTYDHGGDVPDVVIGVVASIVARALGTDLTQTGVFQESIDGYSVGSSVTMGVVLAQGGAGMLASEIEICESFRRPGVPISMRG